jgi:hypothetical protein
MSRLAFVNGLLGVILIVLGLGIWSTWARSLPPEPVVERTAAAKPAPESRGGGGKGKRGAPDKNATAALPPTALVSAIVEKDLFDPSRQKPTEEAAKVTAVARETGPPPGVTLVGLRIFGRDREALVTDQSQGTQQRRLRVGDQVGGYTVQQIAASSLTLTSPSGDPVTMALNVEKGHAGTPAKPAPGVPPRPGQPGMPPQPTGPASPAAGNQTAPSPAAGVGAKAAAPISPRPPGAPTAAAVPPPVPGQPQQPPAMGGAMAQPGQLPPDVQEKMNELKHRAGRNRQ